MRVVGMAVDSLLSNLVYISVLDERAVPPGGTRSARTRGFKEEPLFFKSLCALGIFVDFANKEQLIWYLLSELLYRLWLVL